MFKKIDLHPDKERFKNFSFSTCVIAGDFVYTSHQGGVVDDEGKLLNTVEEQTEQAFKNLERALTAGGATLDNVVKMMIYMKNADDFQAIEDIYKTKFKLVADRTLAVFDSLEGCFNNAKPDRLDGACSCTQSAPHAPAPVMVDVPAIEALASAPSTDGRRLVGEHVVATVEHRAPHPTVSLPLLL